MKLSIDYNTSKYTIKGYKTGSITVNNKQYSENLIITPDQLITPWEPNNPDELNQHHIEFLVDMEPEIILLGTGRSLCFPHPSLISLAMQKGIGFEVMDTGSACRTFNVLISEDRNVMAALMMV